MIRITSEMDDLGIAYPDEFVLADIKRRASELPIQEGVHGIDPLVEPWVRRVNAIRGVATSGCCQGHPDKLQHGYIKMQMCRDLSVWWKLGGAATIALKTRVGTNSWLMTDTLWYLYSDRVLGTPTAATEFHYARFAFVGGHPPTEPMLELLCSEIQEASRRILEC